MTGFTPSSQAPSTAKKRKDQRRNYRSQCKICKFAIYEGEPVVWLTKPMGQSHQGCAALAGAA